MQGRNRPWKFPCYSGRDTEHPGCLLLAIQGLMVDSPTPGLCPVGGVGGFLWVRKSNCLLLATQGPPLHLESRVFCKPYNKSQRNSMPLSSALGWAEVEGRDFPRRPRPRSLAPGGCGAGMNCSHPTWKGGGLGAQVGSDIPKADGLVSPPSPTITAHPPNGVSSIYFSSRSLVPMDSKGCWLTGPSCEGPAHLGSRSS